MEGFISQPRFFAAARKKPGSLELACRALKLGVDVRCVDSWQQTPLFYAAREGNIEVARMILSLGTDVDFVDKYGETALDYAVRHDCVKMVLFLVSMGAAVTSVSLKLAKSDTMKSILQEAHERKEARTAPRKRKRDFDSIEAFPNGLRRAANVSWAYSGTEAPEPEILRQEVEVIHENERYFACAFAGISDTVAKRIRRSAPRPQESNMNMSGVCTLNYYYHYHFYQYLY